MAKSLTLEVPDESFRAMRQAAQRSGMTLEEWAVRQLRQCAPTKTVSAPEAVGIDNESIDRDLAREYAGKQR